ncbi:hypothetical protein GLYMA_04G110300v4 [Glycine max]|uniref:glycerophosphodiester phosphodiesterase n=1 Tax=Glycine soja TaxID=3848 RepID=A0A445KZ80_GLYSO|nr:hypothetical protein GLYMA_04G110300v4 [Glycine max]KAH1110844.1 hypothetical protein GYH30_009591 [Glycine max]RZC16058.1 Glycerophosphodiester phosphodiesterase GDPD4 [Glycine soja]
MQQSSRSRKAALRVRVPSRKLMILSLAIFAILPPIFFHFRLRRLQQLQLTKCRWLNDPPLVCAHGGDSSKASPNTMASYFHALQSRVDCIEIDVSRSSDGVLFALHDRDLQRLNGNTSSKVGYMNSEEIRKLSASHQSTSKFTDESILTIQDALMLTANSVRQIVLDVKVGPPFYEKKLAKDVLSIVILPKEKNNLIIEPQKFSSPSILFSSMPPLRDICNGRHSPCVCRS